ncbi:unnamed protein product [Adineta ricciae]|uniref:Uncharacterized protein n=1 Tax=Adineta ricciae TaxID=249248 RepID=A0A815KXB4_ADIRI|nr:unnamed protein product [Adineta ricciae]
MRVSMLSIGRLSKAQLLPGRKNQTTWLYNQTSTENCLCTALRYHSVDEIAGLNSFSSNTSCQLILAPPILSPSIIYDIKSTLLLLHPFTDTPCCSDFSWMLDRMKRSGRPSSATVPKPTLLSIDSTNRFLSSMQYKGKFYRFHRTNLSLEGIYSLPAGYICASSIYKRGYIFFGCDTPSALMIFKETNLASPLARINMTQWIRGVSFARNDTLMFVAVQEGDYGVYIYNISWTPQIFVSLAKTFPPIVDQMWTIHTVNDSCVLTTCWSTNEPVYKIQSPTMTSMSWSRKSLPTTKVTGSNSLGEAVTDPCGRIWVVVYGFGIRIYDQSGTILLGNWSLTTGVANILLLDNYEVFVTEYDQNFIYHFDPVLL